MGGGHPASIPEWGPDEVSSQELTFGTTSLAIRDPQVISKSKTLGAHFICQKPHCVHRRTEVTTTAGPRGQLSDAKSPPFQFL